MVGPSGLPIAPVFIGCHAIGEPKPKGSMRPVRLGGKIDGPIRLVDVSGAPLRRWMSIVAEESRSMMRDLGRPLRGPVEIELRFRLPMPKSRPRSIREMGRVLHSHRPDIDKLSRGVLDAMQASEFLPDDAQVARLVASKWEIASPGWIGCEIDCEELS